jgi:hypothetical protein
MASQATETFVALLTAESGCVCERGRSGSEAMAIPCVLRQDPDT